MMMARATFGKAWRFNELKRIFCSFPLHRTKNGLTTVDQFSDAREGFSFAICLTVA